MFRLKVQLLQGTSTLVIFHPTTAGAFSWDWFHPHTIRLKGDGPLPSPADLKKRYPQIYPLMRLFLYAQWLDYADDLKTTWTAHHPGKTLHAIHRIACGLDAA